MTMYDQIAKVAYSIYEKNGKVEGRELDNWLEAERIVLGQEHKQQGKISETPVNNKKVAKRGRTRKSAKAEISV
jgi:Protein of unknown function (DUF2934)